MKILSLYWASLLLSCTVSAAATNNQQAFFGVAPVNTVHGRFLHITDIHMDKHYITGATIKSDCHREPKKHKHRKKKEGLLAGYWGAPGTNCDSPARLVYYSIDYIAKEWKDKIDFVIWTGDNARHDGDAYITRTKKEIVGYNQKVTDALKKAFTTKHNHTLPIVPCIGNNDIHPHNELRGMKNNPQLLEFSAMWSDFIPSDQQKHFKKGGYFAVDVAPGMRVLSLNSLYFFGSNDVVNSCSDKSSPGARHVHWLRKQLKHARRDGVKVIMMGHVPPTVKSFKDSCLDDYIKLSTKFADIITGHMYGHANFDHFQIISKALDNSASAFLSNGDIHALQDTGRFVSSLHKQYKQVKKVRDHKSLVVVNVAPPMLPLFYPTFRINEYNANLSSPQFGDWLKYTQWYTNLTYWNEQRNKFGKHALPTFEIEYATDKDYHMSDLTRESWLKFAQRISSKKGRKLWKEYMANMFVRTNNDWYGQSVPDDEPGSSSWDHVWDTLRDIIDSYFY